MNDEFTGSSGKMSKTGTGMDVSSLSVLGRDMARLSRKILTGQRGDRSERNSFINVEKTSEWGKKKKGGFFLQWRRGGFEVVNCCQVNPKGEGKKGNYKSTIKRVFKKLGEREPKESALNTVSQTRLRDKKLIRRTTGIGRVLLGTIYLEKHNGRVHGDLSDRQRRSRDWIKYALLEQLAIGGRRRTLWSKSMRGQPRNKPFPLAADFLAFNRRMVSSVLEEKDNPVLSLGKNGQVKWRQIIRGREGLEKQK